MILYTCEQRTDEWDAARMGKFTASIFDDLMPAKSKPVDSWTKTQTEKIYEVCAERMTRQKAFKYKSRSMDWGREEESKARQVYEIETESAVEQVGFIELNPWVGCSPDGLIKNTRGLTEFKCPDSDTHLMYRSIPGLLVSTYFWQVQGQLWITERDYCDLTSFDSRFYSLDKQIFIVRVNRDEEAIKRLAERIESAIAIAETILSA